MGTKMPLFISKRLIIIPLILFLNFNAFFPSPFAANKSSVSLPEEHFNSELNNPTKNLNVTRQSILSAPDAEPLDEFGWSVAISNQFLVIGARNADSDSGNNRLTDAGAVYVFERQGNIWSQTTKLVAKDAEPEDGFGTSVAIDRDTVVIGAPGHDITDEKDAGAVYIFVHTGDGWIQQAKITADDPHTEDNFGCSVAIEGNTVVIGADGKDQGFLIDAGAAYIFIRNQGTWKQQAKLTTARPKMWDYFGTSVAIYGHRAVIGATQANLMGELGTGAAYVFVRNGKSWNLEATLSPDDGRPGDFFGHSVGIFDDTIVVGALLSDPYIENNRLINAGSVYVFSLNRGAWKQQAKLIPLDAQSFDHFGQSVFIRGKYLLIGANHKSIDEQFGAGAAYLYFLKGNKWEYKSEIVADQPQKDDYFGQSVALYEDYLAIGANGRDLHSAVKAGETFIYRLTSVQLPATGFSPAPNANKKPKTNQGYLTNTDDISLEIPALHIRSPIVGVPQSEEGWDVSWLWDQVGYLQGTAFPTWQGNTGLAAHVNLPDGTTGPFANLHRLAPGDKIFIHAWGQKFVYEVRETLKVKADEIDVLSHEEEDWITLITCENYDPIKGEFQKRLIVRAILIEVEQE
jgi:LPXTG-site transpeptidase (sortase) family protein